MKESLLTNCEREFIKKSTDEYTRLDGRSLLEARPLKIYFGSKWGCCIVSLGHTRVAAGITCDIKQPKVSRPNEGMVYINVEMSSLAAQQLESTKQSEITVLVTRQLEKCLYDSNCIDLEALCIVADKKVWNLRVDVNILNNDGNLIDCSSIAAITALMHFHRPDVTSTGEDIIIHPFSEKDPLPLTLYHYPVCVSFITMENGKTVMDPTYIEERAGVATLTLGLNSYRELCCLHFYYLTKTMTVEDVIPTVMNDAAAYAKKLVDQIKEAVTFDVQARYKKDDTNTQRFKQCIAADKVTSMMTERLTIKLRKWGKLREIEKTDVDMKENEDKGSHIKNLGQGSAELIVDESMSVGEGGPNTWNVSESSENDSSDIEIMEDVEPEKKISEEIELSGDSEEETTDIVSASDLMK